MTKRESLADRLIRVCEEKTKLEFENQKLRENCIVWQKAYQGKADFLIRILGDFEKIDNERSKIRDENSELKSYNHLAKLCFERCGMFIVENCTELGINDYLINELGLNNIANVTEENMNPKVSSNNDDILSLFKQSSNHI